MQTLPRNLGKRHFFDQLTLVCKLISTLRFKKAFVGVSSVECVRQAIEFYNGSVFKGVVIGIQVPKNMPWLRKMVQDLPKNAARSQQVTPQPNPEGKTFFNMVKLVSCLDIFEWCCNDYVSRICNSFFIL